VKGPRGRGVEREETAQPFGQDFELGVRDRAREVCGLGRLGDVPVVRMDLVEVTHRGHRDV
jgi:hypothetical protein